MGHAGSVRSTNLDLSHLGFASTSPLHASSTRTPRVLENRSGFLQQTTTRKPSDQYRCGLWGHKQVASQCRPGEMWLMSSISTNEGANQGSAGPSSLSVSLDRPRAQGRRSRGTQLLSDFSPEPVRFLGPARIDLDSWGGQRRDTRPCYAELGFAQTSGWRDGNSGSTGINRHVTGIATGRSKARALRRLFLNTGAVERRSPFVSVWCEDERSAATVKRDRVGEAAGRASVRW